MQRNIYTSSYEITPQTLAILAQKKNKNLTTQVLEAETVYTVNQAPSKVIDYACKFFGASLKG